MKSEAISSRLLIPTMGNWTIERNEEKELIVSPEKGGILLVDSVFEKDEENSISLSVQIKAPPQLNRNSYIIFNYHNEENYSFIGGRFDAGQWYYGENKNGKNVVKLKKNDVLQPSKFLMLRATWSKIKGQGFKIKGQEFNITLSFNGIDKMTTISEFPTNFGLATNKSKVYFENLWLDIFK